MRGIPKGHVPLREKGDIVAAIRETYLADPSLVRLERKFQEYSRPTLRKVLDDATINCPHTPVAVRPAGRRPRNA